MKHLTAALLTCLLAAASGLPVFPAVPASAEQTQSVTAEEVLLPYAVDAVKPADEEGRELLQKHYRLKPEENPSGIPTGPIEYQGRVYRFQELLKEEKTKTEKQQHTERVEKELQSADAAAVCRAFPAEMEYRQKDGYAGVLTFAPDSVTVTPSGYTSGTRTVTAARSYPGLADADLACIPKTISENGSQLALTAVEWSCQTEGEEDEPVSYTAEASYAGTAAWRVPSGYTASAEYSGILTRTSREGAEYTAVFAADPDAADSDAADPEEDKSAEPGGEWLLLPGAAGGAGLTAGILLLKRKKGTE